MKQKLRAHLLKKRDAIPPDRKKLKDASIKKRLFALETFKKAACLLMYVSFRSEVNTRSYLQDVLALGKRLVLPVVDPGRKVLHLYEIKDISELVPGYMGIPEPGVRAGRQVFLNNIDLVVIPGTGFNLRGSRLGYGGGYYDRLLSLEAKKLARVDHIPTVALAYEEQIGDHIPDEPHDIKVDIIITDKRIIKCPSTVVP
ncbi:MAG: 5-formyltetrahydrofolate cyclo-ligase [Nitrospiraceae bacterium]|nr:MAG: 5-formyltetrahydrofolate cyclo-ligase [Nitrospiraceae bacterium]